MPSLCSSVATNLLCVFSTCSLVCHLWVDVRLEVGVWVGGWVGECLPSVSLGTSNVYCEWF